MKLEGMTTADFAELITQTELKNYINTKGLKIIKGGLIAGMEHTKISQEISTVCNIEIDQAKKIAGSAVMAFGRLKKFQSAQLSKIQHFSYHGIKRTNQDCAEFCYKMLFTTYTVNQINEMENGTLDPVFLFGGGLGCPHTWEPDPLYEIENK